MFQVKEVSKLLGVDRSFLHYYDEVGIIVPKKNEKKYRYYNENDIIALASSKYYRAMHFSLKSLTEIIQVSNLSEKVDLMKKQKQLLLEQAELYKDIAIVCDYAINTYEIAYQDRHIIPAVPLEPFEFIPFVSEGRYDKSMSECEEVQKLLDFFPFVSFTYYFPISALVEKDKFTYFLGLSVISSFREKYHKELPKKHFCCCEKHCIVFSITKDMQNDGFTYEDFNVVREYANEHHLTLTGEAVAYCVFSNYVKERAKIKFVVQIITK